MTRSADLVLYWDASAIISALFHDGHSQRAVEAASRPGTHLLSTLAWTEVHAVIARMQRERVVANVLVEAALEALDTGPWVRVNVDPIWNDVPALARTSPLRGADLWHLAASKSLQRELPELRLLTFDQRLATVAVSEGLAP